MNIYIDRKVFSDAVKTKSCGLEDTAQKRPSNKQPATFHILPHWSCIMFGRRDVFPPELAQTISGEITFWI